MKLVFKLIQFATVCWATYVLPDGYAYVPWVVAIVWGLTEYLNGLADGWKQK